MVYASVGAITPVVVCVSLYIFTDSRQGIRVTMCAREHV